MRLWWAHMNCIVSWFLGWLYNKYGGVLSSFFPHEYMVLCIDLLFPLTCMWLSDRVLYSADFVEGSVSCFSTLHYRIESIDIIYTQYYSCVRYFLHGIRVPGITIVENKLSLCWTIFKLADTFFEATKFCFLVRRIRG